MGVAKRNHFRNIPGGPLHLQAESTNPGSNHRPRPVGDTRHPFNSGHAPHVLPMNADPLLRRSIVVSVSFVTLLWCIKLIELLTGWPLVTLGIYPLSLPGLQGIVLAPLVHGSLAHIAANTFGLLVLGTALLYGYPKSRWAVLATIWLLSGAGVWLFARPSFHIGASGLSHGLFFFLLVVSVLRRDRRSIALMMLASLLFGGMFWGILPGEERVSFEYHLFGGVAGVLAALLFWRWDPKPEEKHYDWENEASGESLDHPRDNSTR